MLGKLAIRNAKRSTRDYLVYFITMTIVSGLMFAFNSMIFSKDVRVLCAIGGAMEVMIGLASIFIIIILTWLINYMINFMMEKRSKEFGTYLLIGMKKKEVSNLFMVENQLLGAVAFIPGVLLGLLLQQILTAIFYSVFNKDYQISIEFNIGALLLTLGLYVLIYILALIRNKKRFKKMNINDMMHMDKQNEFFDDKNSKRKQILFFISILYFIFFDVMIFGGWIHLGNAFFLITGLIISVYLMYYGISSFVIQYIKKGKLGVYKSGKIFLLRQFSSKIKTMQFTMGTLTILFTASLLGGTVSMMLCDYNKKELDKAIAFDIMLFSDNVQDDFKNQLDLINKETETKEKRIYNIYEDKAEDMNQFLYNNYYYFTENPSNIYKDEDRNANEYFDYDTYMKLSDYNALRRMIGYEEVTLSEDGYLIHVKERMKEYMVKYRNEEKLVKEGKELKCEGVYTEPFSQNGQNGSDYIIVVSDRIAKKMSPFYSLVAVDIEGESPEGLQENLEKLSKFKDDYKYETSNITYAYGTDQIFSFGETGSTIVKTNLMNQGKFVITMTTYPIVYMALVFVCVALTILSVQQLSDANKYKFRYSVLSKLGLNEKEIDNIILKQLGVYYLCPLLAAVAISIVTALFMSEKFVLYTGVHSSMFLYYGMSLIILGFIYTIYFIATYVSFKRNVYES